MITLSSNLNEVLTRLIGTAKSLTDTDGAARDLVLRKAAVDLAANMKERIHTEGRKTDESQIGKYSNSYLKIREAKNRGQSKKVILSLTRQMENDFSIVAGSGATGYALGFKNEDNAKKAGYAEERYGDIYTASKTEIASLRKVVEFEIAKLFEA